jgi:hypothetical protein
MWESQARKQPSQPIDGKLLSVLSHVVSEKTQPALRKEQGGLIHCGAANAWLFKYVWSNVSEETNLVLIINVYNSHEYVCM